MKKIEEMKVYHDLIWAARSSRGFDKLFHDEEFISKFAEWHGTKYYEKWKNTREYQNYLKWQDG